MERQMQGEALERMDVYNPEAMRNVAVNYHPTGKTSKRHTHDFYEINYLLRGEAVNEVSGHSAKAIIDSAVTAKLKYELSYTAKSIQELSDEFNFPSQSYFTRYYKRMTGLTPSEYRKERAMK